MTGLRRICDERGVLLIADEVQTGMGRTGKMFACDHEGVSPDILTMAKALGGGVMPIGATLATTAVCDKVFGTNPLLHTSTFGGNPLACAAGIAALEVIAEENLADRAAERGERLMAGLRSVQEQTPGVVKEVRGMGLMVGVEFFLEDAAGLVMNQMAGHGIIAAYTLNNPCVIRMEPPLIVTEPEIDRAVEAFRESVTMVGAMLAEIE
jgi:putrescine aminotransferase